MASASESTSISVCPNGYTVAGIGHIGMNGYTITANFEFSKCTSVGCSAKCPDSKSKSATCEIRAQCCQGSNMICEAGTEATTTEESHWSSFSSCASGSVSLGAAEIGFEKRLGESPRSIVVEEGHRCDGGRINLGRFSSLQSCTNACANSAGCELFSFSRFSRPGECFQEKANKGDCDYTVDAKFDLFTYKRTVTGYEGFECNAHGCRVKCFGTHCKIKSSCCYIQDELPITCHGGSLSSSTPNFDGSGSVCSDGWTPVAPQQVELPISHQSSFDLLSDSKTNSRFLWKELPGKGSANYQELSISLWFKTSDVTEQNILSLYTEVPAVNLWVDAQGALNVDIGETSALSEPMTSVNDNRWHHVCLSYRVGDPQSFVAVDGRVERRIKSKKNIDARNGAGVTVGVRQRSFLDRYERSESFVGRISGVHLFQSQLSLDECIENADNTASDSNTIMKWDDFISNGNPQIVSPSLRPAVLLKPDTLSGSSAKTYSCSNGQCSVQGYDGFSFAKESWQINEWLILGSARTGKSSEGTIAQNPKLPICGVREGYGDDCPFTTGQMKTMWKSGDMLCGRKWSKYVDNSLSESSCTGSCNGGFGVNLNCHFSSSNFGPSDQLAYAVTYVHADKTTVTAMHVGSTEGHIIQIISNDDDIQSFEKNVFQTASGNSDLKKESTFMSETCPTCYVSKETIYKNVYLRQGWNTLLVKIGSSKGQFGFVLGFDSHHGLKASSSPPMSKSEGLKNHFLGANVISRCCRRGGKKTNLSPVLGEKTISVKSNGIYNFRDEFSGSGLESWKYSAGVLVSGDGSVKINAGSYIVSKTSFSRPMRMQKIGRASCRERV